MSAIATQAAQAIAAPATQARSTARLLFVDNLRVFLTVLVVLHHCLITYSHAGSWLYQEGNPDFLTSAVGAWLTAIDHAFFMGLFLLISAYFVPGSYDRKGAVRFVKDRLIRLGIPLAIFSWLVFPALVYFYLRVAEGWPVSWWAFYPGPYFAQGGTWIGAGPTWFISALLIFSLFYVGFRLIAGRRGANLPPTPPAEARFPSTWAIIVFALLVSAAAFVIRLWYPSDRAFAPLQFQFADFAQYIALFVVGLVAYRRNWLLALPESTGRRWLWVTVGLILIWWPTVLLGGVAENPANVELFKGGLRWQAALSATWQSFICVGMCISLVYLFRRRANVQGRVARFLSRNAYGTYLIHAPVLVILSMALSGVAVYPLLKWALVGLLALAVCFGLSSLLRRLPYADRVL